MFKTILLFIILSIIGSVSYAQDARVAYVVDSILVVNDPEEGNDLLPNDIADVVVIKNKDTLQKLGYGQFEGVSFVITKAYRSRPDSIKRVPSTARMQKVNGVWLLTGMPYNGKFIDYYYSGHKQGDGFFINGKLSGARTLYYQNGKIKVSKSFTDGVEDGLHQEFYEDGSLSQKGLYKNGKEEGVWEDYYPNGQVKQQGNYNEGQIFDTVIKYYSTGKVKEKVFIKNNKVVPDPHLVKINQLMAKSSDANKGEDIEAAIKYCTKVIELDSTYAEAYFSRGTLKLNNFLFDEAIADLDKAIALEPYYEVALANRAFARIRKYQFAGSRVLSKNKDVTVSTSPDIVSIPDADREKICKDLQMAIFLGNKPAMVTEALVNYCTKASDK